MQGSRPSRSKASEQIAAVRAVYGVTYVEAALGLQVWSHSIFEALHATPHEHAHGH